MAIGSSSEEGDNAGHSIQYNRWLSMQRRISWSNVRASLRRTAR